MNMRILGIDTSCDETAVAVVADGRDVLSNVIASQIKAHQAYGGVVPELASRKHIEAINYIVDKALTEANVTFRDVAAVAVTNRPGLIGALPRRRGGGEKPRLRAQPPTARH